MEFVNRAILLLAGRARRMGKYTDNCPKALLNWGQTSILENALRVLSASGIKEVILVVGYRGDMIRGAIGAQYQDMRAYYVVNPDYGTTNTAYSLWLAREWLNSTCYLIEGDIIFDSATIERIHASYKTQGVWAVVPAAENRDEGILLRKSAAGNVSQVTLVRDPSRRPADMGYKCAGIQLISGTLAKTFAAALDEAINDGKNNIYADLVLSSILEPEGMALCSLDGLPWSEIDTFHDLERARQLHANLR